VLEKLKDQNMTDEQADQLSECIQEALLAFFDGMQDDILTEMCEVVIKTIEPFRV
jgi:hypothetical protein